MVELSTMKNGVYLHIPFCRRKCDYCSFYSIPVSPGAVIIDEYIDSILREMQSLPDNLFCGESDSLYFGGGTPSMLSSAQLSRIITMAKKRFSLDDRSEVTVEMNPEDLTHEKIAEYVSLGINRIVLGVQALESGRRGIIGRRGDYDIIQKLELFFSENGFTRCVDLIAGIPGDENAGSLNDLSSVAAFRPEHISLYLLSIEQGTPLASRLIPCEDFEDMQASNWEDCIDLLIDSGYAHYEISNFAIPGFESVHNTKYWHFVPYAGLGAGAHSFTGEKRYSNNMSVHEYIRAEKFQYTFDERSNSDIVVEFFMTALRDLRGFSSEDFVRVTGMAIPPLLFSKLDRLIDRGEISYNGSRYSLSRRGLLRANMVVYEITEDYIGNSQYK